MELMINDWVFRPCCNDKITQVFPNGIIGMDNLRGLITYGELQPIPLTAEILVKNDFRQEEDGAYTFYEDELNTYQNYIAVSFRHDMTVRHIEINLMRCHVNYDTLLFVHEFQHALRLCGLNKLANEFKV